MNQEMHEYRRITIILFINQVVRFAREVDKHNSPESVGIVVVAATSLVAIPRCAVDLLRTPYAILRQCWLR